MKQHRSSGWRCWPQDFCCYFNAIPRDLQLEIFKKLDAISIGTCRLVSKLWNKILTGNQTMLMLRETHLVSSHCDILFVCQATSKESDINLIKFNVVSTKNNEVSFINKRMHAYIHHDDIRLVMPITCDLVALRTAYTVRILNPTTGEVRELSQPFDAKSVIDYVFWSFNFGFAPGIDEYVVFILRMLRDQTMEGRMLNWRLNEVLTSKKRAWKDVCDRCPHVVNSGIVVDRYVYLPICKSSNYGVEGFTEDEELVSFDICQQKFEIIYGPGGASWNAKDCGVDKDLVLLDLNGLLCITNPWYIIVKRYFEIWSWKKKGDGNGEVDVWCWNMEFNTYMSFCTPEGLPITPLSAPFERNWIRCFFLCLSTRTFGMEGNRFRRRLWCFLELDLSFDNIPNELAIEIFKKLDVISIRRMDNEVTIINEQMRVFICERRVHRVLPITCDLIGLQMAYTMKVLNPTTGRVRKLLEPFISKGNKDYVYWSFNFGLSSWMGEYVVLILHMLWDRTMEARMMSWRFNEKLSPRKKVWRDVAGHCPRSVDNGLVIGRHAYMPVDRYLNKDVKGFSEEEILVSFDISDQRFEIICAPEGASWSAQDYTLDKRVVLLDLNGVLCVANPGYVLLKRHFEIWSWKRFPRTSDAGDAWGWNLEFNTYMPMSMEMWIPMTPLPAPFDHNWMRTLFLCPKASFRGEFLMSGYDYSNYIIFDPVSGCYRDVKKPPLFEDKFDVSVGFYWPRSAHF
ncbi:OLC1v1025237C1 [Oldenlandia corymbosa var. corymbosa]|uniref:OLC1v1025237C1 n=1 Tax=Oldenlandia corymbosa var. corymbosa TaxID=529605 RepID=A0AAV1C4E1_OLDCO|nr:OLC1v1025237C1 [Oldenlandia corymbosa var. corymbosa]